MKAEETPRQSFLAKFKDMQVALTFRDVLILPGRAEVEPSEVDVHTRVRKRHALNIPFVSSPMDTVTESDMAIAVAAARRPRRCSQKLLCRRAGGDGKASQESGGPHNTRRDNSHAYRAKSFRRATRGPSRYTATQRITGKIVD